MEDGYVVMLRSGGALMTVIHVGKDEKDREYADCEWIGNGIFQERRFFQKYLVQVSKPT